jgi:hypothetical protein
MSSRLSDYTLEQLLQFRQIQTQSEEFIEQVLQQRMTSFDGEQEVIYGNS